MSDNPRAALPPWFRPPPPAEAPGHALIIGGGIAGAATAAALIRRGWRVTVAEWHDRVAAGASGNPTGIHMPRVVAGHSPERDFHAIAWRYGLAELARLGPAVARQACGVLQLSVNERQVRQQEAVLRSGVLPPDMMRPVTPAEASELAGIPVAADALWFPDGGWIEPGSFCRALLDGADVRTGIRVTTLQHEGGLWHAGEGIKPADVVVLANSVDARAFSQSAWLPLSPRRGQISVVRASERSSSLRCVISHDGYIIPARQGRHVIGATFDHIEDAIPAADQSADTADDARNLAQLTAQFPGLLEPDSILSGRASLRAMTTDHLPLAGPLPVLERFAKDFTGLRQGRLERTFGDAVYHPGLWVIAGLGARGLVTAPLAGDFLAAQISSDRWPVGAEVAAALHPARFMVRDLKRARL
jgi:tRNA 5-methylaminomethyl-2-thiouridine biosynthesis bifunctional protein